MGIAQTRRPRVARLLTVYAVLLGLFLMHGSPTSAGEGCHDGSATVMATTGDRAAGPMTGAAAMDTRHFGVHSADAGPQASGPHCLATPTRSGVPRPAAEAIAVAVLAATAAWAMGPWAGGARYRRRGPPTTGRALLLRVCVART